MISSFAHWQGRGRREDAGRRSVLHGYQYGATGWLDRRVCLGCMIYCLSVPMHLTCNSITFTCFFPIAKRSMSLCRQRGQQRDCADVSSPWSWHQRTNQPEQVHPTSSCCEEVVCGSLAWVSWLAHTDPQWREFHDWHTLFAANSHPCLAQTERLLRVFFPFLVVFSFSCFISGVIIGSQARSSTTVLTWTPPMPMVYDSATFLRNVIIETILLITMFCCLSYALSLSLFLFLAPFSLDFFIRS